MTSQIISIGNMYEFNHRLFDPQPIIHPDNFAVSAEYAMFWGNNHIVVTPHVINPQHIADLQSLLDIQITSNLVSVDQYGSVIAPLSDKFNGIVSTFSSTNIEVQSWGVTHQHYHFQRKMVEQYSASFVPTFCLEPSYLANIYCDSKVGSKLILSEIARRLPFFEVPQGLIALTKEEVFAFARILYRQYKGLVIKANHGHGGKQVVCLVQNLSNSTIEDELRSLGELMEMQDWHFAPYILEDYIDDLDGNDGLGVSFDGEIDANGQVYCKGISRSYVVDSKTYVGVEMGQGVFSTEVFSMIRAVGEETGQSLSKLGHRGWFDVDMVYRQSEHRIFGLEINARKSGGTQGIKIMERVHGEYWWERTAFLSVDKVFVESNLSNYDLIRKKLWDFNQRYQNDQVVIIPVTSGGLILKKPYFSYVIYAPDISMARKVQAEFDKTLSRI